MSSKRRKRKKQPPTINKHIVGKGKKNSPVSSRKKNATKQQFVPSSQQNFQQEKGEQYNHSGGDTEEIVEILKSRFDIIEHLLKRKIEPKHIVIPGFLVGIFDLLNGGPTKQGVLYVLISFLLMFLFLIT